MAKNCYKCALPIGNEQLFVTCKQWKCSTCSAKDLSQTLISSNSGNSYVGKLDDLLSRITKLQDEQKGIVNSMINELNDTMGNYVETINNVTTMLTTLQSQLDECTNDKIETTSEDVTHKHEEQQSSTK
ncbi:hypothetical protein O3M35_010271 [Rhynocoris fuscipes]|uniref:Uncharacterized protein n=1 Tax=Rhynocoris fuscipes TaxID=488301 RepID=A0AAW1D4H1_9HEMI